MHEHRWCAPRQVVGGHPAPGRYLTAKGEAELVCCAEPGCDVLRCTYADGHVEMRKLLPVSVQIKDDALAEVGK